MGERGPLPQPDNVRELHGNPSGRKAPARPKAVPAIPTQAAWLDREAKAEWSRVVPELERLGLLTKLDRAVLHRHCDVWSKFVAVGREIRESVLPDETHRKRAAGGIRKHPLWPIYIALSKDLASTTTALGLSPNARGRMTVPEPENADGGAILD